MCKAWRAWLYATSKPKDSVQICGGEMWKKEKENGLSTLKRGRTTDMWVERNHLLWPATWGHGEVAACAASENRIWVHGHTAVGFCVNVHDSYHHQRPFRHPCSGCHLGPCGYPKSMAELTPPLIGCSTSESGPCTLPRKLSRAGPAGITVGKPALRA